MKFVTFKDGAGTRVGCLQGDIVLDLSGCAPAKDMLGLIAALSAGGNACLDATLGSAQRLPLSALTLLAPIPRPAKNLFCVGKNYHEHAAEFANSGFDASSKTATPELPIFFSKPPTTVIADGAIVPGHLDSTNSVDYENELAVVIGRGGRGISKEAALDHVFGYTIVNDVTSRTLQRDHKQWLLGKGIDGFCPMGPAIVTRDEFPDVRSIWLTTTVNGERRQHAQVKDLIFDIPTLISTLSRTTTLEPGDIIATGTPAGVGIGFNPPKFLRAGDVVRCEIEGIGALENTIE